MAGREFWDRSAVEDMVERSFGDRVVRTYPDLATSPYHALKDTAARSPEAVAIVDDGGRSTSYGQLLELVDAFASYLTCVRGVGRGSRLGLLCYADLEFVVTLYAASKVGAMCVPLPTKYRKPELVSLMQTADLRLLIADEQFATWAEAFPVAADDIVWSRGAKEGYGFSHLESPGILGAREAQGHPEDIALMIFTSGTTHAAKGVLLTNYNVCHAAETYARLLRTTPADRCLIPVPIYHVTGLVALLMQFVLVGATSYLHRRFDARRVVETVLAEGITYLHATPTVFAELLPLRFEAPALPSLRVLLSGSSYEPVRHMRLFHEWLPQAEFRVVYGLTETASPALLFPADTPTSERAGATGVPVPGIEVRLCDDAGAAVAIGEVGELWLRGACVTVGYCHGTEGAPAPDGLTADGWLKTGDLAYEDDGGYLWVVDRKKDMINRGGEKVWCSALEEVLCELDGVRASCVTGIAHELYGEVPVAAIVPEPGHALSERGVQSALAGRLARFEIPAHLVFVDRIPTTRGEKPDRGAVRDLVRAAIGSQTSGGSND